MDARLADPWFDAQFYGQIDSNDLSYRLQGAEINGAQGLKLTHCPCGYAGNAPSHAFLVPFANPRGAPPPPDNHGPLQKGNHRGPRPRWQLVGGTSLHDLTIAPSIDVGDPSCWHGYIQNGTVSGIPDVRVPSPHIMPPHAERPPPPTGTPGERCRLCGYVEPKGYVPALAAGAPCGLCIVCARKLYQEGARLVANDGAPVTRIG